MLHETLDCYIANMSEGHQFAFFIAVQCRSWPKAPLAATLRLELSKKRKCEVCVEITSMRHAELGQQHHTF
jgi:hypothetical protein